MAGASLIAGAGLVAGMVERLEQEGAHMVVVGRVEGKGSLPSHLDKLCQSQLGQVLRDCRLGGPDELCQVCNRRLVMQQGPEDLDPGWLGQHAEAVAREADLLVSRHREFYAKALRSMQRCLYTHIQLQ